MTQTDPSPAAAPPRRRSPRRFHQARATLVLLLASAGMLGYSAVQASRPHPVPGPGMERTMGEASNTTSQQGGEQP